MKIENDDNLVEELDYLTAEKLMNFLPFKYNKSVSEKELIRDLLIYSGDRFDALPELTNILNIKDLLKFLYVFSGKELKIPEKRIISNSLRDLDIFYCYSSTPNKQELNRLSKKYSITVQNIMSIINKCSSVLSKPNPLNPLNP